MWFMNKIANPIVRLILRSPLHGMLSGALLLLTYTGRKSGKEYTLPVQYAREQQVIYIVPGAPAGKTWWRNLRRGAQVRLWLAGKAQAGKALVLEGDADADQTAQALQTYLRCFPSAAKLHGIRMAKDGTLNPEDLRQAALSAVVVRVDIP
jgi:deazaflavin-dependent oxidoreductase (nitroreductase family)